MLVSLTSYFCVLTDDETAFDRRIDTVLLRKKNEAHLDTLQERQCHVGSQPGGSGDA